jgi:hypothetical protein
MILGFKTEYIGFMPLFDKRTQSIVENDRDFMIEVGLLKIPYGFSREIPTSPEDLARIITRTNVRLSVQSFLISNEFTHNSTIN